MLGRRTCRRRRDRDVARRERGAAAVEFALVVPILLLLVFGTIQYGFYFWAKQGASSAARDAARRSAVGDYAACAELATSVTSNTDRYGSGAAVSRSYAKGPGNALAGVQIGDTVSITVTMSAIDLNLPLVPYDPVITESVDSRVEYVPTTPAPCT